MRPGPQLASVGAQHFLLDRQNLGGVHGKTSQPQTEQQPRQRGVARHFATDTDTLALLFPLVILPLIPLLLGLTWILSAIGVYFRDLGQALVLLVNLLLFLSPVFYSTSTLSPELQFWIGLNPLTQPIENMRNVLFAGLMPDLMSWFGSLFLGLAVAMAGAWMFTKTRDGFADVL